MQRERFVSHSYSPALLALSVSCLPAFTAKVYNGLFLLFQILAWISTCVAFGGVLAVAKHTQLGGAIKINMYHDRLAFQGQTIKYGSDLCDNEIIPFCDKCNGGGKGFIAMSVFAFLCLLVSVPLTLSRMFGCSLPRMEPTRKVLFFELVLTALTTLFFFLAICIFGGACFHAVSGAKDWSVTGTGFGFTIACFFLLVAALVLIYRIRGDSNTHLGAGAGGEYAAEENTTSYNPPSQYQYNADPAAAYAGSYHSDVMPATQSDNAL